MKIIKIVVLFLLLPVQSFSQLFDAEIIDYTTNINIKEDKLITKESYKIVINKRAQEERFTDIEIIYRKNEKISSVEGRIEDLNGKIIRQLQKKDIKISNAQNEISFYDDFMSLTFSLRHNIYPYIISYSYVKTTPYYLIITEWSPVFRSDIPTKKATLKLTVPKNFEFKYDQYGIGAPEIEESVTTDTYTWNASFQKPIKDEIFSPPAGDCLPLIKITPKFFTYGVKGCSESWSSFGTWYSDLNMGLDQLPPPEILKVNELVKEATTDKEKIKILFHYLQDNTRYIAVTLGHGGYKSMPAQYVSENKYGDCKALTNYTKALLKTAGIESFFTLVDAGDNPIDSEKGIPFPNFNHVILLVPDGNDSIWLECTSQTKPFNYLGSFTSGRKALVINNEKTAFVNTPMPSFSDVETVRNFDFKVNSLGILDMNAEFLFKGEDFDQFLSIQNNLDLKQQKMLLNKFFAYTGLQIDNYKLSRESRDAKEIAFVMSGGASQLIKKVQNDLIINPISFDIPDFEIPSKRKLPVDIFLPIAGRDTINIEMTSSLNINSLPQTVDFKSDYGYYRMTVKNSGNKITMIKEFGISPGDYPIEKYPDFYSFIMNLKKFEKSCLVVVSNSPRK